jgi:hypothetical protein
VDQAATEAYDGVACLHAEAERVPLHPLHLDIVCRAASHAAIGRVHTDLSQQRFRILTRRAIDALPYIVLANWQQGLKKQ